MECRHESCKNRLIVGLFIRFENDFKMQIFLTDHMKNVSIRHSIWEYTGKDNSSDTLSTKDNIYRNLAWSIPT